MIVSHLFHGHYLLCFVMHLFFPSVLIKDNSLAGLKIPTGHAACYTVSAIGRALPRVLRNKSLLLAEADVGDR